VLPLCRELLEDQIENRRNILWKTCFGPWDLHGSAHREDEFKSLSSRLDAQAPELEKMLQEAMVRIPQEAPSLGCLEKFQPSEPDFESFEFSE
jgi:hypothetical protein